MSNNRGSVVLDSLQPMLASVGAAGVNPAPSTTRYFGAIPVAPTLVASGLLVILLQNGYVKRADVAVVVSGVAGSPELGSMYLRISKADDYIANVAEYLISDTVDWSNARAEYIKGFAPGQIPIVPGSSAEIVLNHPAWVTTPTLVSYGGGLLLERVAIIEGNSE